ncbi:MAG: patatin-like phospholipase family protein [Archangium sp.]|nr:patatin-like phospholipase family protein [Archangium sp.]
MNPSVGLVLSGGGARGAYEVGILSGIAEAVGRTDDPLFRVVAGTSVGAINGAWLVAHAHQPHHALTELEATWKLLSLEEHLRVDLKSLVGFSNPLRWLRRARPQKRDLGRSVLDPTGVEALVHRSIRFDWLHRNIDQGLMRAFVVAALHIGTGVTTLFTELAPGVALAPTRHPRRLSRKERITADHVLASAAIPALFPARRIGHSHFVDGSLRFNTPIAPVLRAGADRLIVISLKHEAGAVPDLEATAGEEQYPDPLFMIGKILNALMLDAVSYDLQVLDGLNRVMGVLDEVLSPEERKRFDQVLIDSRGTTYRKVPTLAFEPSQNISLLAGQYLANRVKDRELGFVLEWLVDRAAAKSATWESDLASYLLFDGGWAARLIELGRHDALLRRDEIREFFAAK